MWGWVSPIAALVGAIGGPAAWYTVYRQRPRKMTLSYELQARPAFPGNRKAGKAVRFELDGRSFGDPHELSLYLRPDGRRDLKAEDFGDSGVFLDTGAPIVAILDQSKLDEGSVTVDQDSNTVKIAPQILKRGELASLSILVEGKPQAQFDAKLAEVSQQSFNHSDRVDGSRLSPGVVYGITGFAAAMLMLSGIIGWKTANTADTDPVPAKTVSGTDSGRSEQCASCAKWRSW